MAQNPKRACFSVIHSCKPVSSHFSVLLFVKTYLNGRAFNGNEAMMILTERKSLAAIYITCLALIVVLQSIHKNALDDIMGGLLEETTFEQFRKPDMFVTTRHCV